MTTEQQPETKAEEAENTTKKTTDNKALFGPLGKYAVIAVIMVSIIVTTAIMLDKQLNNVEQEIAVLEDEVSDIQTTAVESTTPATTIIVEQDISVNETVVAKASDTPVLKQAINKVQPGIEKAATEEVAATEVVENTTAADTTSKSETATQTVAETSTTDVDDKSADKSAATRRTERNKEILARNQANKLKQKQRMSESYARINKRENQQLEQFKTSKDKQIVRLREQGTHEQQFIDALILRNNELVAIRKANMQKQQANREQRLNRI